MREIRREEEAGKGEGRGSRGEEEGGGRGDETGIEAPEGEKGCAQVWLGNTHVTFRGGRYATRKP